MCRVGVVLRWVCFVGGVYVVGSVCVCNCGCVVGEVLLWGIV